MGEKEKQEFLAGMSEEQRNKFMEKKAKKDKKKWEEKQNELQRQNEIQKQKIDDLAGKFDDMSAEEQQKVLQSMSL